MFEIMDTVINTATDEIGIISSSMEFDNEIFYYVCYGKDDFKWTNTKFLQLKEDNMYEINDKVDISWDGYRYQTGKIVKKYPHDIYDVQLEGATRDNMMIVPVDEKFIEPHKKVKSFPSDFAEVKPTGYIDFNKANEVLEEIQDGKTGFFKKGSILMFRQGNEIYVVDGYRVVNVE